MTQYSKTWEREGKNTRCRHQNHVVILSSYSARETETDMQTDWQTVWERKRLRERETETETETDRDRQKKRKTNKQRQTDRQTDREINTHTHTQRTKTERQRNTTLLTLFHSVHTDVCLYLILTCMRHAILLYYMQFHWQRNTAKLACFRSASDENGASLKPTWHAQTLNSDVTVSLFP